MYRPVQWRSQEGGGGGGGAKGAIAPPFFKENALGCRAICHVVFPGDEQTR